MAWGVKYRHQFYDIHEVIWTTDIHEEDYSGDITTFKGSGDPLTFEFYGNDNIFDQNVLGSKMTLNIWVDSNFAYSDLFTSDDLEYKVIVYHGAVEYWTGYILANNYQEPYDHLPVMVSLVAIDGLGLLKNFKFVDIGYTERETISTMVYDMLELVGISSFTEYINIYEDSMDAAVGDSLLEQAGIDPDLFKESSCYEALEVILKTFNAGIRQDLNIITLYRFVEVAETTMYGRVFDSGSDNSSDVTKTPLQYLKRAAQASNLWDYDGGVRMIVAQAKETIVNYDIGYKQSALKHWEFLFDDFDESGGVYTIDNWTSNGVIIKPFSLLVPGEDRGIHLDYLTQYAANQHITQVLENVKTRSPSFKLSFDYRIHNKTLDPLTRDFHCVVYLIGDADTKYWDGDDQEWNTNALSNIQTYKGDIPGGWNDWMHIDIPITGIPNDGDLYVKLYSANDTSNDTTLSYRDVKLVMTPVEGTGESGIAYTVTGASTGKLIEEEMKLGSGFTVARYTVNQLLNYYGIINAYDSSEEIDPGNTWFTRGNSEDVALLDLISSELGAQFAREKDKIDVPVRERTADTFLSLTGNIKDTSNTFGGNPRTFAITRGSYSVRMREWDLTLNEII